jgi:hypothetical protein
MDALISLYLSTADYLERGYRMWRAAVDGGDALAMQPRWVAAYEGNLEGAQYWRDKAAELEGAG